MKPRIAPLDPPHPADIEAALRKWMPPGAAVEPLALFRTLARHPLLFERMRPLGSALLGKLSLAAAERELVILRTCARAGADYEWGVHVAAFAAAAGLGEAELRATRSGDGATLPERQRLILRLCDELHDTATVSDALWDALSRHFAPEQALELTVLAGFYRLISYVINVARVTPETWAASPPPA
jgi:alkylhydroperoxidase family enzyme